MKFKPSSILDTYKQKYYVYKGGNNLTEEELKILHDARISADVIESLVMRDSDPYYVEEILRGARNIIWCENLMFHTNETMLEDAPDIHTYRIGENPTILIMGGSNRPEPPLPRYTQHEDWTDPQIYRIDGFHTIVMNESMGCIEIDGTIDKDKSLIIPEIKYPEGVFGDFNTIDTWNQFKPDTFDLIVFDWSTDKFFNGFGNKDIINSIMRVLKPTGSFWIGIKAGLSVNLLPRQDFIWKSKRAHDMTLILDQYSIKAYKGMPFKSERIKRHRKIRYGYDGIFLEIQKK
jgi:hypothetical protein